MNIDSLMMSNIYEVIFSILEQLQDNYIFIVICKNNNIEVKVIIGSNIKIKNKLKLEENIIVNEKHYDNDTNLSFIIKSEVSL